MPLSLKACSLAALTALFLTSTTALALTPPPPEPEPDTYMRVCDAYGEGYFYIPGTETCLRIGGFVRTEIQGGDQVYARKRGDRHRDTYAWLSRGELKFYTATPTDYGTLRSFFALRSDWKAGGEFGSANDNTGGSLRFAYIELGGLRVGLDETIFAHWTGYYGNVLNDDVLNPATTRTNVISYTWAADNGLSAILGVEQGNDESADGNNIYHDGDHDIESDQYKNADKGGYRFRPGHIYDENNSFKRKKLSQQTHNYAPYVVGGVKYEKGWGKVSAVFGYDSYYSSWATKLRGDVNITDKWSAFLMAGYKSMDDYYNLDDTYGTKAKKELIRNGKKITRYGIYRQVNSMYGDWGGDWAAWAGTSYQLRPATSLNFQAAYSDDRTYATAANIEHQIVPGLTIIPEIAYIKWDNNYGRKYSDGKEFRSSMKGQDAVQGLLRLQRSF